MLNTAMSIFSGENKNTYLYNSFFIYNKQSQFLRDCSQNKQSIGKVFADIRLKIILDKD